MLYFTQPSIGFQARAPPNTSKQPLLPWGEFSPGRGKTPPYNRCKLTETGQGRSREEPTFVAQQLIIFVFMSIHRLSQSRVLPFFKLAIKYFFNVFTQKCLCHWNIWYKKVIFRYKNYQKVNLENSLFELLYEFWVSFLVWFKNSTTVYWHCA